MYNNILGFLDDEYQVGSQEGLVLSDRLAISGHSFMSLKEELPIESHAQIWSHGFRI